MPKKIQALSYDEFMSRHASEFAETTAGSAISATHLMRGTADNPVSMPGWIVNLLRAAALENCPSAYGSLVHFWLERIGAKPPAGVFIEFPQRGTPGRPRSPVTEQTFLTWVSLGRPSVHKSNLARAVYGKQFSTAGSEQRKKLIDRCRRAIERRQTQLNAS